MRPHHYEDFTARVGPGPSGTWSRRRSGSETHVWYAGTTGPCRRKAITFQARDAAAISAAARAMYRATQSVPPLPAAAPAAIQSAPTALTVLAQAAYREHRSTPAVEAAWPRPSPRSAPWSTSGGCGCPGMRGYENDTDARAAPVANPSTPVGPCGDRSRLVSSSFLSVSHQTKPRRIAAPTPTTDTSAAPLSSVRPTTTSSTPASRNLGHQLVRKVRARRPGLRRAGWPSEAAGKPNGPGSGATTGP
jgi:hypothetical protein